MNQEHGKVDVPEKCDWFSGDPLVADHFQSSHKSFPSKSLPLSSYIPPPVLLLIVLHDTELLIDNIHKIPSLAFNGLTYYPVLF
jgi:hypothetical protein